MTPAKRATYMWNLLEKHPNATVAWYLMCSHLYYEHDISIIPDEDYDELCRELLRDFDKNTHRHKHLVDPESLRAGTGYAIKDYPSIVQSAGWRIAIEDKHLRWDKRRRAWMPKR